MIEAIPANDTYDIYHVSEELEIYTREPAVISEQLFAHIKVLRDIAERLAMQPSLRTALIEHYGLDFHNDRQQAVLLEVLTHEIGLLTQVFAQSLQVDAVERQQLLADTRSRIPYLRDVL